MREKPIPLKVYDGSVEWNLPSSDWSVKARPTGYTHVYHPDTGGKSRRGVFPLGEPRNPRLRLARAWMMYTRSSRVRHRPWLLQRLINFSKLES